MPTTVQVSRTNRERLSSFGKAGESLDIALDRVLMFAEASRAEVKSLEDQEQKDILELNELSDQCLKGNFGFSNERIREIRETARTLMSL